MADNNAYMKKGGVIKKVPLNKWANYRADGWAFSNVIEWTAQQSSDGPRKTPTAHVAAAPAEEETEEEETVELPTMENTKAEILDFASEHGVEVDGGDTKAELIEAIDDALG
jgi:hypothetical protein